MGDPTLADVLERLEALERAVESLRDAVLGAQAGPGAAPGRPTPPKASDTPAPPSSRAGASSVGAKEAAPAPSAQAGGATPAGAQDGAEPPGEDEPPTPSPSDGVQEVLRLLFAAALRESEEESWPYLMALTHSRDLENPRALDYLKAFNWRKLRRSVDRYLVDRDPASFHIVRTDPAEIGDAEYVKVFLHQEGGMPGPVHLRRDPNKGGAWLVAQISL